MNQDSLQKGSLLALAMSAIAGGFKLTEVNVWAGVLVVVVGISLPFLREYLKK